MRPSLRIPLLLALVAGLLVPASALAHGGYRGDRGHHGGGGPPASSCSSQSFTYDTGGAPGTTYPNDPLYPRQWGLTQIKEPAAWARGITGRGVIVAVVDTGVDLNHPDLRAKLVQGFDFVDDDACPQDENGHGTHVAGIAAAVTNNRIGVAGTAPDARLMPVRVLDAEGSGTSEDVVAGIRYAADHGAKVINLSLGELPIVGQLEAINEDIEAAVDYAWARGALVIGAAGNDTFPMCSYPSAAKRSVCVGATSRTGTPSYYSNFPNNPHGPGSVGVRAPGGLGSIFCEDDEDIWSTMWPGSDFDSCGDIRGYETLAGTSMATPFVSGLAAQLFSMRLNNQQVLDRIRTRSSNNGLYEPVYGYGLIDADKATQP